MGVKGQWRQIEPTGVRSSLNTLVGQHLAVDVSIWQIQFIRVMVDIDGKPLQGCHIIGMFNRICQLLTLGIKPIIVFDGPAPILKRRTLRERKKIHQKLRSSLDSVAKKLLLRQLRKLKNSSSIPNIKDSIVNDTNDDSPTITSHKINTNDDSPIITSYKINNNLLKKKKKYTLKQASHKYSRLQLFRYQLMKLKNSMDYTTPKKEQKRQVLKQLNGLLNTSTNTNNNNTKQTYEEQQRKSSYTILKAEDLAQLPLSVQYDVMEQQRDQIKREGGKEAFEVLRTNAIHGNVNTFSKQQFVSFIESSKLSQKIQEIRKYNANKELGLNTTNEDISGYLAQDHQTIYTLKRRISDTTTTTTTTANEKNKIGIDKNSKRYNKSVRSQDRWLEILRQRDTKPNEVDKIFYNKDGTKEYTIKSENTDNNTTNIEEKSIIKIPTNIKIELYSDDDELDSLLEGLENDTDMQLNSTSSTGVQPSVVLSDTVVPSSERMISLESVGTSDQIISVESSDSMVSLESIESSDQMLSLEPIESSVQVVPLETIESSAQVVPLETIESSAQVVPLETIEPSDQVVSLQTIEPSDQVVSLQTIEPSDQVVSLQTIEPFDQAVSLESIESTGRIIPLESIEPLEPLEQLESLESPNKTTITEKITTTEPIESPPNTGEPATTTQLLAVYAPELDPTKTKILTREENILLKDWEHSNQKKQKQINMLTQEMIEQVKILQRQQGVPYITAKAEAEAQCVELEKSNHVNGIISDDSDVQIFGGKRLYKNMFERKKFVEIYDSTTIENILGIDHIKYICLALLLGSDYTPGIRGIGKINAMEIVAVYKTIEGLKEFRDWVLSDSDEVEPKGIVYNDIKDLTDIEKESIYNQYQKKLFQYKHKNIRRTWIIEPNFPDQDVINIYLNPPVYNTKLYKNFIWNTIDVDNLVIFMNRMVRWDRNQVLRSLSPLNISRNILNTTIIHQDDSSCKDMYTIDFSNMPKDSQQTRILSYYGPMGKFAFNTESLRSKRLKDAVSILRKKTDQLVTLIVIS